MADIIPFNSNKIISLNRSQIHYTNSGEYANGSNHVIGIIYTLIYFIITCRFVT